MTERRADNRTKNALLARGIDSTTASLLVGKGHSVGSLQSLTLDQLLSLGLDESQAQSFAASGRPPIPEDTLNSVLYKARWTCCICRDSSKGIIVHHLDQWSSSKSHAEKNLVVLCLDHHGEAHTKRGLSLSLSADRIRKARDKWYADAPEASKQEAAKFESPKERKNDISFLNLFMRFVPFTRLLYFVEFLPISVNLDLCTVGDMFEAHCKDNPHLYPLNDQNLQGYFDSFIESYYALWGVISGFTDVDGRQLANFSQADQNFCLHMERKYLPYKEITKLNEILNQRRSNFITSYMNLIAFIRGNYKEVDLNTYKP